MVIENITPYNYLIERVNKIDEKAASYLKEREGKHLDSIDNLFEVFIWSNTPQGHLYWENIARVLGEISK